MEAAAERMTALGARGCNRPRPGYPNGHEMQRRGNIRTLLSAAIALTGCFEPRAAMADDQVSTDAGRPVLQADRWREDW